ncbi:MAG: HIT family protein [Actinomycetota bacterium]
MTLENLWAGWRGEYVGGPASAGEGCVFCRIMTSDLPDDETFVVWRGDACAALLNAYPYTSGHLMVLPVRHLSELDELDARESAELWPAVTDAVAALKRGYRPDGINIGINLGRAAGAGLPGHLHVHCVPRWSGDTNFTTTVANTRVIPETLATTWKKLRDAWPD